MFLTWLQPLVHYSLHILFPLWIAYTFFRVQWVKAYLILLLTMLVDLDHLLADPIFVPNRCSILTHPLHSPYAIVIYVSALFVPKIRIPAIGLVLHMLTDSIDCVWSKSIMH